MKGARFYGADLNTCCLGFGWWQDYFATACTVSFFGFVGVGFVVMTVVVVSFVKFGLMVVVLGLVIVSVVIVGGLVLTGA